MLLGITMGDSSGVGPELILRAHRDGLIPHPFVVYGDHAVLDLCNRQLGYHVPIATVASPADHRPGALSLLDHALLRADQVTPGRINAASGAAARDYVIAATRAALSGAIDAMVTLPMNKEATQLSDPAFVGHTELIGGLCGVRDVTIMLASEALIVTHVSTHVSLQRAIEMCRQPRIGTIIDLTWDALRRLNPRARIAVAGLNPHAGESGLFGREEIDEIAPAIEQAHTRGIPVEGPFPPDTVFYLAVRKRRFDAIICMYHDQGHVPLKLLDFEQGVNIALGIPIIRTSVDHGTAFDIAWKGEASPASLVAACNFAARLVTGRDTAS